MKTYPFPHPLMDDQASGVRTKSRHLIFGHAVTICLAAISLASARAGTFTFDVDADQVRSRISITNAVVEVTWPDWFRGQGRLERTDSVNGPWRNVGRRIPYRINPFQIAQAQQFYRVRARPVTLHVPTGYDPETPMPLVLLLHAYSGERSDSRPAGQVWEEGYLRLLPLAQSKGFLYAFPDGLVDAVGWQFWSANEDCCDFGNLGVNDDEFLERVIRVIRSEYNVDSKRIYLIGHSNGALMAYEFAANRPDLIAGVVALAPPVTQDALKTAPQQPVNILHVHATSDSLVSYSASRQTINFPIGAQLFDYIGAQAAIDTWAQFNGCSNLLIDSDRTLNLVSVISGADTIVTKYGTCPPGGAVELWTIQGGDHFFRDLTPEFREKAIEWLLQHPKP